MERQAYRIRFPAFALKNEFALISFLKQSLLPTVSTAKIQINSENFLKTYNDVKNMFAYRTSDMYLNNERARMNLEPMTKEQLSRYQDLCEIDLELKELSPGAVHARFLLIHFSPLFVEVMENPANLQETELVSTRMEIWGTYDTVQLRFNETPKEFLPGVGVSVSPVVHYRYEMREHAKNPKDFRKILAEIEDAVLKQGFQNVIWSMNLPEDVQFEMVPFVDFEEIKQLLEENISYAKRWGQDLDEPFKLSYYAQMIPFNVTPAEVNGRFRVKWVWDHVLEVSWGKTFLIPMRPIELK